MKPINTSDLVARVEILYDRIQRKRSVSTLKGSLRDVGLCEILQLFELTRKHGVIHLEAPAGKGELAVSGEVFGRLSGVWVNLFGDEIKKSCKNGGKLA